MADDRDDNETEGEKTPPKEGVRIIGAEEAEKAMGREDVARRRTEGELRYGDRPEPPPADGPAPALRFPLSSADATDIERPPLEDDPDDADLPHWTDPPTGKVPKVLGGEEPPPAGDDEWSSFTGQAPRWRDSASDWDDDTADILRDESDERLGALDDSERPSDEDFFSFSELDEPAAGRSVFADDPGATDDAWDEAYEEAYDDGYEEDDTGSRRVVIGGTNRIDDPAVPIIPDNGGRNVPQAVGVGLAFGAVALILFAIGPAAAMVLVLPVIAFAALEYFNATRRVGYEPVTLVGVVATAAMVLAAYHRGEAAIPAALFLTVVVSLLWYLTNSGGSRPTMNIGVTLLGVLWIGMFGSFAALMLSAPNGVGLLLGAILATVGYDVGGFFVGKNAGRAPLSAASPNKTVEGLVGGMVVAFAIAVAVAGRFEPWGQFTDAALLGVVAAVAAPLGDLCQSMIKRDLGIKDMGSILPSHGGLLDRFDALLFVLPAVYYLARVNDFFL